MKLQIIAAAIVAALYTVPATAQTTTASETSATPAGSHSFVGITGGISIPMGNFSKGDYLDNSSGYAGPGGNGGVMGVYFLKHSRFGITALASYQRYSFNGAQSLADGYKDGYSLDSTTLSTTGSNHAFNVFVGPYYSIPVARHFAVDIRLMGGYTNAHKAGYHVAFEDADYDVTQLEASAGAFGWQVGIAPRYNIGSHAFVMLNVDYSAAKPDFKIDYTSYHPGSGSEEAGVNNQPINKTLPTHYSETLQSFNANLTVGWRF